MFLLWEGGPQCDSLSHFGRYLSFYAAGMEGGEDTGWLYDDFTSQTATDPGEGGGDSPPGSVVRLDPRTSGDATRITVPREGVAAGTRDPSVSTDVGPQSVPARVSVVLVEETGVQCAGRLASVPVDLDEQMLAEMACPAGVAECVDDFILPMLAGTVSPSDVAEQVADDTASLADDFILLMLAGTVSPSDVAEQVTDDTASLADAGILFPANSAGILFPAVPAGVPFLAGPVGPDGPDPTLPEYCFRPFLLGCCWPCWDAVPV